MLKEWMKIVTAGLVLVVLATMALCGFLFVIFVANQFADFLGLWEA